MDRRYNVLFLCTGNSARSSQQNAAWFGLCLGFIAGSEVIPVDKPLQMRMQVRFRLFDGQKRVLALALFHKVFNAR